MRPRYLKWVISAPRSFLAVLAIASVGVAGGGAWAGDGVIEIHPGQIPLTITQPGSYVLTSNLAVPDEDTTAISIEAHDVTLDLAGFRIDGPVVCSASPLSCAPSGGGIGITTGAGMRYYGITLRDGTVSGLGYEVFLDADAVRIEGIVADSNSGEGIFVTGPAVLTDSTGRRSGDAGLLLTGAGTVAAGNTAADNAGTGVSAGDASVLTDNTVTDTAFGPGVFAGQGSVLSGNASRGNGFGGLQCGAGCLATGNTVDDNAGTAGLTLGSTSAYSNNVIRAPAGLDPVSGGVEIDPNVCTVGGGAPSVCDPP